MNCNTNLLGEIMMGDKKYKIGYTSGVFDMFHIGHLNILRKSKELCEYLIVGVSTDELVQEYKNKTPIIPYVDREEIVKSIIYVDKVIPQENMNKTDVIKKYGIDVVFVGSDWKGTDKWNAYEDEFAKLGCKVEYHEHTDGISSTILRDLLNKQ